MAYIKSLEKHTDSSSTTPDAIIYISYGSAFWSFLAGLGVLEINFSGLLNYLLQRVSLLACIKSPNRIASSTQSELENLTGIRLDNYDNLVRQCTTNNGSYSLVSITFTTEPNLQPLPPPRWSADDKWWRHTDLHRLRTQSDLFPAMWSN